MGKHAMLMKYRLPVKIIIVKHNVRGMYTLEQIAYVGNPQYDVQSQPLEFEAVAKTCEMLARPPTIQSWWNAYYVANSTFPAQWPLKLLLI